MRKRARGGIASDQIVIGGSDVVLVEDVLHLDGLQRLPRTNMRALEMTDGYRRGTVETYDGIGRSRPSC